MIRPLEGNIRLTGVGLYDDPTYGSLLAPLEVHARWNSIGYKSEKFQEISTSYASRYENRRHAFVFHESCWSVLERVYNPDPVPLNRLYELCLSMPKPVSTDCINWGHDYGGLYYWKEKPSYHCWEAFEHPRVKKVGYSFADSESGESESGDSEASMEETLRRARCPIREFDDEEYEPPKPSLLESTVFSEPYRVDEIPMILQEQPRSPPVRTVSSSTSRTKGDWFSRLPLELRSEVASYLPTADFLNGRLALRGLWDIFESQQFWSTRFLGHGAERSWVFESHDLARSGRDWRFLYRQTCDARAHHSGGLRNRRRVWELALLLNGILSLEPLVTTASVGYEAEDRTIDRFERRWRRYGATDWVVAQADVCEPRDYSPHGVFTRGCCRLHKQRLRLDSVGNHTRVALSFTQVGEYSYLCGLRLRYEDGNSVQIGYRASTEQVFELDLDNWYGFVLAIGPRGIRGLRFVIDGGRKCSAWYGRHEDLPRTHRLVSLEPIAALSLKFGLDVSVLLSKLIGFASLRFSP